MVVDQKPLWAHDVAVEHSHNQCILVEENISVLVWC